MAMLRDGLRAEIPELFEFASRLRPPAIPAMPLWAASLGGLGARTLTDQLLLGLLSVASLVTPSSALPRTAEVRMIASTTVGIVFAFGAAGPRGLRATGGLFIALWLEQLLISIPGIQVFCSRAGPSALSEFPAPCDLILVAFNGLWPIAAGIAVGFAGRRFVRHGAAGLSALALAMGVWALVFAVLRVALSVMAGPAPEARTGADMFDPFNWPIGATALSAGALGLIAGRWGHRHRVDALVIAAVFLLPWLPQAKVLWETPEQFRVQLQWQMFTQVLFALAALTGLVIGALVREGRPEASAR